MTDTKNAVGYIRVSTLDQADSGLSLEAQRRKVQTQAELSDLKLTAIFEDAGVSAKTLERPAMSELLAMLASGQVDVLIVPKLDRLTRSVKDLATMLERLQKSRRADGGKGVDLISTAESIDTGSATGRLIIGIMAQISQWEREVIAERTSEALQELRAQGRTTGKPRYGFEADADGNLVENPQEQAILHYARTARERGETWQAIADSLTARGKRTRNDTAFSKQGLSQIARKHGIT